MPIRVEALPNKQLSVCATRNISSNCLVVLHHSHSEGIGCSTKYSNEYEVGCSCMHFLYQHQGEREREREDPGDHANPKFFKKKNSKKFKNQKFGMQNFRRCQLSPLSCVVHASQDTPRGPRLVLSTARNQPGSTENRNPDFRFSPKISIWGDKKISIIWDNRFAGA